MINYSDGKTCPYCESKTEFIDSSYIYGRSYGMIYCCKPCIAYVGVHKGTDKALGRLANAELREAKKEAHRYFDLLWKKKIEFGYSKSEGRSKAYKWISDEMKIKPADTHIGMFDVDRCNRVVELCKAVLHVKVGL